MAEEFAGLPERHQNRTGGTGETVHIVDHSRVYPCWCGKEHFGLYAFEDWAQHNCTHDEPLIPIDDDLPDDLVCPQCGKSFSVKRLFTADESKAKESHGA